MLFNNPFFKENDSVDNGSNIKTRPSVQDVVRKYTLRKQDSQSNTYNLDGNYKSKQSSMQKEQLLDSISSFAHSQENIERQSEHLSNSSQSDITRNQLELGLATFGQKEFQNIREQFKNKEEAVKKPQEQIQKSPEDELFDNLSELKVKILRTLQQYSETLKSENAKDNYKQHKLDLRQDSKRLQQEYILILELFNHREISRHQRDTIMNNTKQEEELKTMFSLVDEFLLKFQRKQTNGSYENVLALYLGKIKDQNSQDIQNISYQKLYPQKQDSQIKEKFSPPQIKDTPREKLVYLPVPKEQQTLNGSQQQSFNSLLYQYSKDSLLDEDSLKQQTFTSQPYMQTQNLVKQNQLPKYRSSVQNLVEENQFQQRQSLPNEQFISQHIQNHTFPIITEKEQKKNNNGEKSNIESQYFWKLPFTENLKPNSLQLNQKQEQNHQNNLSTSMNLKKEIPQNTPSQIFSTPKDLGTINYQKQQFNPKEPQNSQQNHNQLQKQVNLYHTPQIKQNNYLKNSQTIQQVNGNGFNQPSYQNGHGKIINQSQTLPNEKQTSISKQPIIPRITGVPNRTTLIPNKIEQAQVPFRRITSTESAIGTETFPDESFYNKQTITHENLNKKIEQLIQKLKEELKDANLPYTNMILMDAIKNLQQMLSTYDVNLSKTIVWKLQSSINGLKNTSEGSSLVYSHLQNAIKICSEKVEQQSLS